MQRVFFSSYVRFFCAFLSYLRIIESNTKQRGDPHYMVSFTNTTSYSTCIDENEFFKQYYNPEAHFRYDSNFFQLKFQPTQKEFELIEEMQEVDHLEKGMQHIKFYWPENTGFTPELMAYFEKNGYEIEYLELYAIQPEEFIASRDTSHIHVKKVTDETLEAFKTISYEEDRLYGEDFAQPKKAFYDWQLKESSITLWMAWIDNKPVGTLTMIDHEETIEIDDVSTIEAYRKQGVATALQQAVMEEAIKENKTVILIADGEDTPKDMYQRQGYHYVSYQVGAQKVLPQKNH